MGWANAPTPSPYWPGGLVAEGHAAATHARRGKPHIAVFAGPAATILNSPPLVTSNKARRLHGLASAPALAGADEQLAFDALRPQRLATPVTVYVEAFSAHPLEADAAHLYAPPDGYVDERGHFSEQRRDVSDRPVFAMELSPDDGLYPLPYMARRADGGAWDGAGTAPDADAEHTRQTWFPDAHRLFEEIDRFALDRRTGTVNVLRRRASFEFFRAAPSAGYMHDADAPEMPGTHYFTYAPWHLRTDPSRAALVALTNDVAAALRTGRFDAVLWLEGSPTIEETLYWLHLVIDTEHPIVGHSAQHAQGALGSDGPRNIVKGLEYVASRVWEDGNGRDTIGAVLIVDDGIYGARDVQKVDAHTGGYVATGAAGGRLGTVTDRTEPRLARRPTTQHTYCSDVNLTRLPAVTAGVRVGDAAIEVVPVALKDNAGALRAGVIPDVALVKYGSYRAARPADGNADEVEIQARIASNLRSAPLAGFVCEGLAPYGIADLTLDATLRTAVFSGMPVVKVGRGNAGGVVPTEEDVFVLGSDLTATKARLLLMAALLRLGALTPAADPERPQDDEIRRMREEVLAYQRIFDTH